VFNLRRVCLAAAVFVSLAGLPATARAEIIDYTGLGRSAVVSVAGVWSGSVYAGELNWAWVGSAPAGFAQTFYSYCVDLRNVLTDPQTVSVRSTSQMTTSLGIATDGGAKAAWLFDSYAATIRSSGTGIQAAALQVAIWEALYDTSQSLVAGNFRLNTTGAIRDQANAYLSSLYVGTGQYQTSVATWLDTSRGQDQLTARVSEPSTLLLFGLALTLFAGWLRRPLRI